jgi:N-acetylglutamate synthase-like GNAT family acetyltransferase
MDPTIRDARAADASAIAALLTQLGYPTDAEAVEERLDRLQVVGDRVIVAQVEGAVVGLAHLQVTPAIEYDRPVGKLGALVVDEAERGHGIGRALVEATEAEARLRGCELFFLTTSERRDDAHAFYESLGLEQTGRRYGRTLSE